MLIPTVVLTPVLLPHLQQVLGQGHSVFFHLSSVEEMWMAKGVQFSVAVLA